MTAASKNMKLEEIYQESKNSENYFKYKNVLFIGSESYDAPTITVLEGLDELGFNIFTIKKPNINSWFCNKIIDNINGLKFDFILSNLAWGTRWSYYKRYNLYSYPKVLIDGDDNLYWENWQEKYNYYIKKYTYNPPEEIKNLRLMPYRWVESLGEYEPDVIFTAQKRFDDKESFYLPFGIHKQYFSLYERKSTQEREFDFTHIPGPGVYRERMSQLVRICRRFKIIPGKISNESAYGKGNEIIFEEIKDNTINDFNVHSYHRWIMDKFYFHLLNNSKVLIYPGIDHFPFWDSKRPWEAYASGCLVLMSKPCIDVSEYPLTEICDFAVYGSYFEFIKKCRYLYKNQSYLDELRKQAFEKAKKYFTSKSIANYFLRNIVKKIQKL
jgi:hypothetical protein